MIEKDLAKILSKQVKVPENELISLFRTPPNPEDGDIAFPCFSLSKQLKKNPNLIAEELSKLKYPSSIEKIDAINAYLNFTINRKYLAKNILKTVTKKNFGHTIEGKGKTVLIEYSSPNIAKSFGIGHLRSTVIGGSIARLYETGAYKVIRINYLGDWGTQFGKLIYAYKKWGDSKKLKEDPINYLQELYVKTNKETNKEVEQQSRDYFKSMELGDEKILKLWSDFRKFSLKSFDSVYKLLSAKFDYIYGESDYNEKAKEVIKELEKKKLVTVSEGAKIVDLNEENLSVVILEKADGTTIYSSRDLAAAIDRHKKFKFHKMIYEVGEEQKLHFKQFFRVLELMGYSWAKNLEHVHHGLYLSKDGKKLSTREGNSYKMMDIWNEVAEKVKKETKKRQKGISEKELNNRVEKITRAAVIYGDLKTFRGNSVVFNPEAMSTFEGDTGPYLLYSYARSNSLLKKANYKSSETYEIKYVSKEELSLLKLFNEFPEVLSRARNKNDPSQLTNYIQTLSRQFNSFYTSCQVIGSDEEKYRLKLVDIYKNILGKSLKLLGIDPLKEM